LAVDEAYTVRLDRQPSQNVTVKPSSDNDAVTIGPLHSGTDVLTFTRSNWDQPQPVRVNGIDDAIDYDPNLTATVTHEVFGEFYASSTKAPVTVTVLENDTAGVTLSTTMLEEIAEASDTTTSYTIALNTPPTADVTVTPTSTDARITFTLPANARVLTFTAETYNVPQTVMVAVVDDTITNPSGPTTIQNVLVSEDAAYNDLAVDDLEIRIADNEIAGVTLSTTALNLVEADSTETYTVVLDTQPADNVQIRVTVTSQDTAIATVSPLALTFTAANWNIPQAVRVTPVDETTTTDRGDRITSVTHTVAGDGYNNVRVGAVTVTAFDANGPTDVRVSPTAVTVDEDGGTGTYTVVLRSQPSGDVTVTATVPPTDVGVAAIAPTNVPEGMPAPEPTTTLTLTFTTENWRTPQSVTVTGIDDEFDNAANRQATIGHVVTGADYGGVPAAPVTVTATDDDTAGVSISRTRVGLRETQGRGTSYTLVLNTKPTQNVEITPRSTNDTVVRVSPEEQDPPLTFPLIFTPTNWNVPQLVILTPVDDTFDNPLSRRLASIQHGVVSQDRAYDSLRVVNEVQVRVEDDGIGITVTPTALSVNEAGGTATYTIVLDSQPIGTVTITPTSSSGAATVSAPLSFTPETWNVPQMVTVTGVDDNINNDGDRLVTVSHGASSTSTEDILNDLSQITVTVSVINDEVPAATISPTELTIDRQINRSGTYQVALLSQPTGEVTVTPSVGDVDGVTVSPQQLTFTPGDWNISQPVTVTIDQGGSNSERTLRVTHTIAGEGYGDANVGEVVVTVVGNNTPWVRVSASDLILEETGANTRREYTIVLNSQPTQSVTITPMSSNGGVATVSGALTFNPTGANRWNTPQTVTVTGEINDDVYTPGGYRATISHRLETTDSNYGNLPVAPVMVRVINDEPGGARWIENGVMLPRQNSAVTIDEGRSTTYQLVLEAQPTHDVTVSFETSADMASISTMSSDNTLTFTPTNWNQPQTVILTGLETTGDRSADLHHCYRYHRRVGPVSDGDRDWGARCH